MPPRSQKEAPIYPPAAPAPERSLPVPSPACGVSGLLAFSWVNESITRNLYLPRFLHCKCLSLAPLGSFRARPPARASSSSALRRAPPQGPGVRHLQQAGTGRLRARASHPLLGSRGWNTSLSPPVASHFLLLQGLQPQAPGEGRMGKCGTPGAELGVLPREATSGFWDPAPG